MGFGTWEELADDAENPAAALVAALDLEDLEILQQLLLIRERRRGGRVIDSTVVSAHHGCTISRSKENAEGANKKKKGDSEEELWEGKSVWTSLENREGDGGWGLYKRTRGIYDALHTRSYPIAGQYPIDSEPAFFSEPMRKISRLRRLTGELRGTQWITGGEEIYLDGGNGGKEGIR